MSVLRSVEFFVSVRKACGANSGVCRLSESDSKYKLNSGNYNQEVIFDKVLTLKYTNGDICPKCNCPRETIITFVCAPEEGDGHPVLKSQIEDCTQVFVWRTNRVCEKEVRTHFYFMGRWRGDVVLRHPSYLF